MASDETVAEIAEWLRNKDYYRRYMGITYPLTDIRIGHILDRIEAAHKREIAAKDAEIAELESKYADACKDCIIKDTCETHKEGVKDEGK